MISGAFTHNNCFSGAHRLRRLSSGQENNHLMIPSFSLCLSLWFSFYWIIRLKESNHLPEISSRNCLENSINKSCWSRRRWFSFENCYFLSLFALCVRWCLLHLVRGAVWAESSLHILRILDLGCACLIRQLFSWGVVRVGKSRAVWWVGEGCPVLQTNGKHIFSNQKINMVIARQKIRK